MFESSSSNLIQRSEALALKEIEKLSNLYGEILTKNEVIERIKDINKNIAYYDLLIESDTFSKLIKVTGFEFPRIKDRIYNSVKYLYSQLDNPTAEKSRLIEYATTLIFSWDKKLSEELTDTLTDLHNFVNCKTKSHIDKCVTKLIAKYRFRKDLYDFARKEKNTIPVSKNEYEQTIPYIEKIGPLLSLYETLNSTKPKSQKKFEILVSILKLSINLLELDSLSIPHMLPSLFRSIIRSGGYKENQILEMDIHIVINLVKTDIVGKEIIQLAKTLASNDKAALTGSLSGERLYYELLRLGFWTKLEYLPELSLLEYIQRIAEIPRSDLSKTERAKANPNAGKLGEILYGKN